MNKRLLFAAAVVSGLGFFTTAPTVPANAQSIEIGPGGVRVVPDEPRRGRRFELDRREAARIARDAGMYEVDGIDRGRRRWVVFGADRRGRDMEVVLDARTGDIIDVDRRGRR